MAILILMITRWVRWGATERDHRETRGAGRGAAHWVMTGHHRNHWLLSSSSSLPMSLSLITVISIAISLITIVNIIIFLFYLPHHQHPRHQHSSHKNVNGFFSPIRLRWGIQLLWRCQGPTGQSNDAHISTQEWLTTILNLSCLILSANTHAHTYSNHRLTVFSTKHWF